MLSILDTPCSSAKSERVYSVGGRNVFKIRNRLKPSKLEHLVVRIENKTKVVEFWGSSGRRGGRGSKVFGEINVNQFLSVEYSDLEQKDDKD